jgi:hypothetical protein
MPILDADVGPYDFYDASELNTDSTVVYLTLTVVSTVSPSTVNVSLASDGEGILTSRDHPVHAANLTVSGLGDFVDITGTSGGAGDGTFQVATVVSDTQLTISGGTVGNSTGGSANFRWQSGAKDIGYYQIQQNLTSSNLVQTAITDVSNHELLDNEPVGTGVTYSNARSGNTITSETWTNTGNSRAIKSIAYTYTGSKVTTEVRKVFSSVDGTTVIAQITITYTYTGNTVTGETIVRNV